MCVSTSVCSVHVFVYPFSKKSTIQAVKDRFVVNKYSKVSLCVAFNRKQSLLAVKRDHIFLD